LGYQLPRADREPGRHDPGVPHCRGPQELTGPTQRNHPSCVSRAEGRQTN
jgi:hypothetical protein